MIKNSDLGAKMKKGLKKNVTTQHCLRNTFHPAAFLHAEIGATITSGAPRIMTGDRGLGALMMIRAGID